MHGVPWQVSPQGPHVFPLIIKLTPASEPTTFLGRGAKRRIAKRDAYAQALLWHQLREMAGRVPRSISEKSVPWDKFTTAASIKYGLGVSWLLNPIDWIKLLRHKHIAIDTEGHGPNLVQIACLDSNVIYIAKTNGEPGSPSDLHYHEYVRLMGNRYITKYVFGPESQVPGATNTIDVQALCKRHFGLETNPSLAYCVSRKMNKGVMLVKDKKLTCSDWSAPNLSDRQIRYAAMDAWVTLKLGMWVQKHMK